MKKIIISILGLNAIALVNAGESVVNLKSTATMQATCSITVSPIGFGVVSTPLMSQSTQSEMSVRCSNASSYTIDLAYGGVYGQGISDSGYTMEYYSKSASSIQHEIRHSSGVSQGTIACGYASAIGQVYFQTTNIANLYGYTTTGWQPDSKGACISNNTAVGTYPKGWVGVYNLPGKQSIGGSGYAYGVMNGMSKGDKLAYSIQVPGDSTKVWNAGNNSYKSSGNGEFQIIPVVAKIVPDNSGSKYPAPDMYLDTITAVISY